MAKKTEEAPVARRSSYIDVNTGQPNRPAVTKYSIG